MASLFQNAFYIGNAFNGILYGIELMLFVLTIRIMAMKRRERREGSDIALTVFSSAALLLNTIYVTTQFVFGQEVWVVHYNWPGGQEAYFEEHASVWYQTLGTTTSILLNLLTHALMIYRCHIIWGRPWVIIFPCVLYLSTLCVGIAQLVEAGLPSQSYFTGTAHKLGIVYTVSVIGLEIVVTGLIAARIFLLGRCYAVVSALPHNKVGASAYTGTAAILVESALPCTLFGLAYLVSFAMNSSTSILFLSIYVMSTCISPQVLILRVLCGQAWTRHMTETVHRAQSLSDDFDRMAIFTSAFSIGAGTTSSYLSSGSFDTHAKDMTVPGSSSSHVFP